MIADLQSTWHSLHLVDVFDILLVWVVVYRVLLLAKRSGAVQILSGIGILSIAYFVSIWLELITFHWILETFFTNLFLIVVILFQTEIRQALAQLGSNPLLTGVTPLKEAHLIEEIAKAASTLAQKGLGALIVIENEISLDYFIELGPRVDAEVQGDLLLSLFQPSSPLHDGAVLIRSGRIEHAGCFLPLSKNPIIDRNLGTRHRAALGLTEESDAFVLVVSEENRSVSLVSGGQLVMDVDHFRVRKELYKLFNLKMKADPGGPA